MNEDVIILWQIVLPEIGQKSEPSTTKQDFSRRYFWVKYQP